MTMPHLMNCPHKSMSHCLDCVKAEWERREEIEEALSRRVEELEGALTDFKRLGIHADCNPTIATQRTTLETILWYNDYLASAEPERALREAVEAAYREGFEDGFDHGTLSYKYPDVDQAWPQSQAAAFLARHKETP